MNKRQPFLILVSGLPCTGKTSLAKRIASRWCLPLIYKDIIKDRLFDTLGWKDRDWSRRLSAASFELLFTFVESLLWAGHSCIAEANFAAGVAPRAQGLVDRYSCKAIEVQCITEPQTLLARFRQRAQAGRRHPGNRDDLYLEELNVLVARGHPEPLLTGAPFLRVDTTYWDSSDEGTFAWIEQHVGAPAKP